MYNCFRRCNYATFNSGIDRGGVGVVDYSGNIGSIEMAMTEDADLINAYFENLAEWGLR